jgi:hypothetical protein
VYVKIDIGKTVEHNKIIYYWLHNTIVGYTMQLVSTQQWGGYMIRTLKCLTGSRSVYIGLYIYHYIYVSVSLY